MTTAKIRIQAQDHFAIAVAEYKANCDRMDKCTVRHYCAAISLAELIDADLAKQFQNSEVGKSYRLLKI